MEKNVVTPNSIEIAADIVSAYVSNNSVPAAEVPALLSTVHECLTKIARGQSLTPAAERQAPAVPVRVSVTPDYIICLENGKKFKSLKRHLGTAYGMTPEQYRSKWGLPQDYPMVARNYAKARSEMAKAMGLGQPHNKALRRNPRLSKVA